MSRSPTDDALLPAAAARRLPTLFVGAECARRSRRGWNRCPDSGRVLYACAPRHGKDLALWLRCMRNAECNRAPLSGSLG